MYRFVNGLPFEPTWSVADNPNKNTLFYHEVQHQKFEWMLKAVEANNWSEVIVWLDWGICRLIPIERINAMLERLHTDQKIYLPGCWPPHPYINDANPCWRFCGGLMIVPRKQVKPFTLAAMSVAMQQIITTKHVTWEVNTMARVEQERLLPIEWYGADHNSSMCDNYP